MDDFKSRRDFLKGIFLSTAGALLLKSRLGFAAPADLPAGQKALSESDPSAMRLGYKHNAKDIDFAKFPKRKDPAAKDQLCKSCMFYTPANSHWGKCNLFPAGLVSNEGWCMSWVKKK
jgi:hypothetical protein